MFLSIFEYILHMLLLKHNFTILYFVMVSLVIFVTETTRRVAYVSSFREYLRIYIFSLDAFDALIFLFKTIFYAQAPGFIAFHYITRSVQCNLYWYSYRAVKTCIFIFTQNIHNILVGLKKITKHEESVFFLFIYCNSKQIIFKL